jgi:hypothetical protein
MNPLSSNSSKSLLTAVAFSWLSQLSLHAADIPVLPTGQVGNTAVENDAKDASMVDGINVQPFWKSGEMTGEPVLFIQQAGAKTASGKLIFTPTAKLEIKNPDGSLQYELGKDYRWAPGSRVIELTKSTRIPFKMVAEMTPGKGKPKTIGGVLHSEGRFFYDLQMMVSYQHDERMKDLIPAPRKTPAQSYESDNI